jgi:hypothetical protein
LGPIGLHLGHVATALGGDLCSTSAWRFALGSTAPQLAHPSVVAQSAAL